ncbi:MAG: hypothetical protein H7X75_11205 [Burkholderiaceae bacterium]|nr:hypothetical protein [Burkholderiaceae bacterium]
MKHANDNGIVRGELGNQPTDKPTEREISQKQAIENAQAARATHQSAIPGVPDDNPAIQGWVAAMAAPIEGAADAMREGERERVASKSSNDKRDDVAGPRSTDEPNVTNEGKPRASVPTRPEDAEWDPLKATAEHRTPEKPK